MLVKYFGHKLWYMSNQISPININQYDANNDTYVNDYAYYDDVVDRGRPILILATWQRCCQADTYIPGRQFLIIFLNMNS